MSNATAAATNARKDFSTQTIKALAALGITIVGAVAYITDPADTYGTGTAYELNDNGTHRLRTFAQVRQIAAGTLSAAQA